MKGLLPSVLVLAVAGPTSAVEPSDVAARIVGAALVRSRAYDTLAHLTDRIGPRLSGSSGLESAVRWTAAEMERNGADRAWTDKVMVPHWVRGAERARIVAPVEQTMHAVALGGSVPTPEEGITAEVIEAETYDELHALGATVKGKIVLYSKRMVRNGGEKDGYGAAVRYRSSGAVEAAKLGAVGALLRSVGTATFRLPHTGMTSYDEQVPKIPFAAIADEDADLIHRLLQSGNPVRVQLVLGCAILPDSESANVIADFRGRDKADEIVVIGAHLDSWDLGTGAIDDGAGVAIVMETMRLLKSLDLRPRRTIRAVLFTNEENGLRGGRAYAEAHRDELPGHVAAIESDSGGAKPLGFGVSAGTGGDAAVRAIAANLKSIGADEVTVGGGGADISPMRPAGVPQIGLRQDATRYFDYHHTAADTLDKVDPHELAMNVAALAVLAYSLAERDETLPRIEPAPAENHTPARP